MVFLTSRNVNKHVRLALGVIVQPLTPKRQNSPGFLPSLAIFTYRSVVRTSARLVEAAIYFQTDIFTDKNLSRCSLLLRIIFEIP